MSADLLRRAAEAERVEWGSAEMRRIGPRASAIHLALADWLEATESTMRHVMDDLAAIEGQPTIDQLVGYDFVEAIAVARLILGEVTS